MSRQLQKIITHLDGGVYIPTDDITLTIRDAANTTTIISTASYASGAYTATFDETAKWGIWAVDGVTHPEWGKFWLGHEDALVLAYEFKSVSITTSPETFITGTAPLVTCIRGNTVPTFTQIPNVYVQGLQERQVFISTVPTLDTGNVTFELSLGEAGLDNPDGNKFNLMIISNEQAKS